MQPEVQSVSNAKSAIQRKRPLPLVNNPWYLEAAVRGLRCRTSWATLNERKTETLVEDRLRRLGYFARGTDIIVERQQSDAPRIKKLLNTASKRGGGVGKPEFLIRSPRHSDFIIVVECKADTRKHISATLDRYGDFAVDGALLYASHLSRDFDVLAIGVSGETPETLRISHYFHLKGADTAVEYTEARGLRSFDDYYDSLTQSDIKFRQDYQALLDYSRELNNQLQARKVTEAERGFLISGILIALQHAPFRDSFRKYKNAQQLADSLLSAIDAEFQNAKLPGDRLSTLRYGFAFIASSPALVGDLEFLISLIDDINSNINAFMRTHEYFDTIGEFYVEFLRYANNDKGLGIVLTPHHIGELFAALAEVDKHSIVFDNCCGTAGLLVAAMRTMVRAAGANQSVQKRIKQRQIYGIEFQPKIYALSVSNMILHGDGKTNIHRADCLTEAQALIRRKKPNVGLLNPPYKNKKVKSDHEELEFVLNNLDCLSRDGRCVAIVPMTCATAPDGIIAEWKRRLLERHTLEGVMSMPIELFHNSNTTVVTCIMVFTAHRPHSQGKKTWFGYWRDDGFVKTKHRGRVDLAGSWPSIRDRWVTAFRNREVLRHMSVMREVGPYDEWCAEAYLPADYRGVSRDVLVDRARRHLIGQVLQVPGKAIADAT